MTTKSWRRLATWAIRLLLLVVLGLIAFAITVLTVIPRATHGTALTVLTGSMTPGIPVGSVVIDRPVDPGTLHVGDIATYQKEPGKAEYITHRIAKIDASKTPTMFTFKGDANRGPDALPVPATAIRGKVWFHVPYVGAVRDALHTRGGLAGVGILLLAGYALYQGAAALRDKRVRSEGPDPTPQPIDISDIQLDLVQPKFAMIATVARDAFDGLSPMDVCSALGGTLLVANEQTFTLVLARMNHARDALELLEAIELYGSARCTPDPFEVALTPVAI